MKEFMDKQDGNKKIVDLQELERKHKEGRLKEFITRGEMEGWAGMVHERSDIAFKAVRVLVRTLLRKKIISEIDLADEEKKIRSEIEVIEGKKKLCPNEFSRKNDTNVCKLCKVQCPFEADLYSCSSEGCPIDLKPNLEG